MTDLSLGSTAATLVSRAIARRKAGRSGDRWVTISELA
jgi:hypothetical protein